MEVGEHGEVPEPSVSVAKKVVLTLEMVTPRPVVKVAAGPLPATLLVQVLLV